MKIYLRVEAEGARGGMLDGHFGEGPHDGEGNEGAGDETDDYCGSGELYGDGAAEEEAGANGAAQADHGDLAGGELAVETGFALNGGGSVRRIGCGAMNLVVRHGAAW